MIRKSIKLAIFVFLIVFLADCAQSDHYDNLAIKKNLKAVFDGHSEQGNDENWDSTADGNLATRASGDICLSQVDGLDFSGIDWERTDDTTDWTIEFSTDFGTTSYALTDGRNASLARNVHTALAGDKPYEDGQPSVLIAPGTPFYIFPVYAQGSRPHTLWVQVGNKPAYQIYEKEWNVNDFPYFNGMTTTNDDNWKTYKVEMPGVLVDAPAGTPVQLYLNVDGDEALAVGTGSGHTRVVAATHFKPQDIEGIHFAENDLMQYIGFEDNATEESDNDYNDLVLCIVGSALPQLKGIAKAQPNASHSLTASSSL